MPHNSQSQTAERPTNAVRATAFDEVTEVQSLGGGRFSAELHQGWTVAGKPNGGYLLAVLARAATQVSRHSGLTAASAHFLRPPHLGPASVTAEPLRQGRSVSHVRARLFSGDELCLEALITLGDFDPSSQPDWEGTLPLADTPSYDDCIPLKPDPAVFPVPLLDQVDLRLDPDTAGWTTGAPTDRGELRGWLALPHAQPFDPVSLLFAVDAFPPATFDVRMTGWVPTLQLSAYVRAVPVPGPVRVLQRAQLISDQRVDETCLVWDQAGRLVAQATQLASIRLG